MEFWISDCVLRPEQYCTARHWKQGTTFYGSDDKGHQPLTNDYTSVCTGTGTDTTSTTTLSGLDYGVAHRRNSGTVPVPDEAPDHRVVTGNVGNLSRGSIAGATTGTTTSTTTGTTTGSST
eukprot:Lankesteria_metandrocarpae@DN4191_c0_g1_i1.p3